LKDLALPTEARFRPIAEFWRDRRVLVTGHTGFKGGWLTLWLSSLGARVWGMALPPEGPPNFFEAVDLAPLCTHRVGDVRKNDDIAAAVRAADPEIVFHLAAQSLVRRSYRDPLGTIATNVIGTAQLLDACRSAPRLRAAVIVTSDKVYENRERHEPYRENESLGGHDPYAASKACADLITASYRRSFFPDETSGALATVRAGNVIGGGDWAEDRLLPDLARAFSANLPGHIRRPQAVRPWQHVVDVTRGYLMLARALAEAKDSCPSAVNLGPKSDGITVGEIADQFTRAWGDNRRWQHDPDPEGAHEAGFLAVDSTLAFESLGWTCEIPVAQALAMSAAWYKRHAEGATPSDLRAFTLAQIAETG